VRLLLLLLWFWVSAFTAQAHEVRPSYLSITETAPSKFSVIWKQPVLDGKRLKIALTFPEECTKTPPQMTWQAGSISEHSTLSCTLIEGDISFLGLERTITDIFVSISYLSREKRTALIKPSNPTMNLGDQAKSATVQYFSIGVEHIIFGWDHLLFVIGLILLVARRQLLGVVTAFTLAHSITLGLAAFGLLNIPTRPVEILIAASIVMLGIEIIRKQHGSKSLATRRPYLISFIIGLIHGCGFASALSEIGLPKETELLALLFFNLGVEFGQFSVIGLALIILFFIAKVGKETLRKTETFLTYGLSSIAMFWVMQRLSDYII